MRRPTVRLNCETLEDRATPAVAFALSGVAAGAGNLLAFDTAAPTAVTATPISGIAATELLAGIDFRPQNGLLYGLGVNDVANTATLYTISTRTGVATPTGAIGAIQFTTNGTTVVDLPNPVGTGYGFDFNPTVDRIRVVAGTLNFRVNPNTGAAIDGDLNGGTDSVPGINTDANINGSVINLDASAYSNNLANVTTTTLFGLDNLSNALYIQAPANAGTTAIVGTNLGINFTLANGFDISASGTAFAVLTVGDAVGLYTINTTTGIATLVGPVGSGSIAVQGFAVQSDANGSPVVAMNAAGTAIVRFNTASPGTVTTAALPAPGMFGGVNMGDVLVGLDYRPNTGQLLALAVNTTNNTLQLYRVSPQNIGADMDGNRTDTASVTAIGVPITNAAPFPMGTTFPAGGYGVDLNPTAANGATLLRVTTGTGLNFRIIPSTGVIAGVDTPISGSGVTGVISTAYTNSFGQGMGGTTTQYTLDAVSNMLYIQGPVGAMPAGPNGGVQGNPQPITVGGMPLDFSDVGGFDIPAGVRVATSNTAATGFGFAALTVSGVTSIYRIDLATGAATNLGATASNLNGLSVADTTGGVVGFQSGAFSGTEGTDGINVVLTRTGGTGPQTVIINVTGGNAIPVDDFAPGPYTVVFADGATTATLNIPFVSDNIIEGPETVNLAIASVSNGLVNAQTTAVVTVNDPAIPAPMPMPGPDAPAPAPAPVPIPPPAINSAGVIGNLLVLQGPGLPGGIVVIRVPDGTFAGLTDLNGDGIQEVVIITPTTTAVIDAQTTRFLALSADTNGDGVRDLLVFNFDNTTTNIDGRTGVVVRR